MAPSTPISDPLVAVAFRFKRERQLGRFTQAEIAEEIGVTRALISHFEQGVARLSFAAGYAFCRRANLNPRWLATGAEPQRPFVSSLELGVCEADVDAQAVRGVDFLEGYAAVLAAPLEQWAKGVSADDLIERQLSEGAAGHARRCSDTELHSEIERWTRELKTANPVSQFAALLNLYPMLEEFEARLKRRDRAVGKLFPQRRDTPKRKRKK